MSPFVANRDPLDELLSFGPFYSFFCRTIFQLQILSCAVEPGHAMLLQRRQPSYAQESMRRCFIRYKACMCTVMASLKTSLFYASENGIFVAALWTAHYAYRFIRENPVQGFAWSPS